MSGDTHSKILNTVETVKGLLALAAAGVGIYVALVIAPLKETLEGVKIAQDKMVTQFATVIRAQDRFTINLSSLETRVAQCEARQESLREWRQVHELEHAREHSNGNSNP